MERNKDKIKRLEHELGRWRKKAAEQKREIEKLQTFKDETCDAVWKTHAVAEAMQICFALTFGEEAEVGGKKMHVVTLKKYDAAELLDCYDVAARQQGEEFKIFVAKKENEP